MGSFRFVALVIFSALRVVWKFMIFHLISYVLGPDNHRLVIYWIASMFVSSHIFTDIETLYSIRSTKPRLVFFKWLNVPVIAAIFKKRAMELGMSRKPTNFIQEAKLVIQTNANLKSQTKALAIFNGHLLKVIQCCDAYIWNVPGNFA